MLQTWENAKSARIPAKSQFANNALANKLSGCSPRSVNQELSPAMLPIETQSGLRQAARGLRLKYWAMWLVLAAPLLALAARYLRWDVWDVWWTTGCILAVALLIDTIGRILCLIGRILPSKSLVVSTTVQVAVILLALGLSGEVLREPAMGYIVFAILVLGQIVAAFTFTRYLRSLAEYANDPQLMRHARGLLHSLIRGSVASTILLIVMPILLIMTLLGTVYLYYLGFLSALFFGSLVLIPLAVVILSTAIRLFTNYGILLARLPRALSRQAEAPEDTVVMARLLDDSTRVHDR